MCCDSYVPHLLSKLVGSSFDSKVVSNPANKLNSVNIFANEGSAPILFSSELVSVEEVPVLSLKLILATYTPSGGSVPNSRGASSRPDVPITSELGRDVDAAFDQQSNDHRFATQSTLLTQASVFFRIGFSTLVNCSLRAQVREKRSSSKE